MNGKYALALFFALQVTVSLCEIADPDPELVQKFDDMKNTFYLRLQNAYNKVHGAATPYVEKVQEVATPYVEQLGDNTQAKAAKDFFEELKNREQAQTVAKFFTTLYGDAAPVLEKAQHTGLGLYGQYLRPQVGESLDGAINKIKEYLNLYFPA